jgi:hypothetical protein
MDSQWDAVALLHLRQAQRQKRGSPTRQSAFTFRATKESLFVRCSTPLEGMSLRLERNEPSHGIGIEIEL